MKHVIRSGFFVLVFLFGPRSAGAQQLTDSLPDPVNNAVSYLKQVIGLQSGLYNGQEYLFYSRREKDNPFFHEQTYWELASITYDGVTYTQIPLMYDLYHGQVIAQLYDKVRSYVLNTEKIAQFTLQGHHFIYRYADSLNTNGPEPGLYDQLYGGQTEVLVKREKTLITNPDQSKTYPEKDRIFIKRGSRYFSLASQHALLTILKDKKKELGKFINDNNISFKDNREMTTMRIATWYDKIKQTK